MESADKPIRETRWICGFYLLMAGIGLLLASWRSDDERFSIFGFPGDFAGWALAVAAAVAGIVVGASHWSMKHRFGRRWATSIRSALGNLPARERFAIALFSGVGEELFFRGWMLNEWGLLVSSVIFGCCHVPMSREWLLWPVFAFLMGLILGAFCIYTQTIYWAIIIHVAINAINLNLIYRRAARIPRQE